MFDTKFIYKIVLTIIIVMALIAVIYFSAKAIKKSRDEKILSDNKGTTTVSGGGVTSGLTVDIGAKVSEINDALHGSAFSEDEQKAINAVLSTPKPLIPKLSSSYFALTGLNLSQDLQKYLSGTEWLMVSNQFN